MEERKKEGDKQTIEQRNKEKRKNQALVFEFHCFLSTFGIHTHSEYEFSQLTPRWSNYIWMKFLGEKAKQLVFLFFVMPLASQKASRISVQQSNTLASWVDREATVKTFDWETALQDSTTRFNGPVTHGMLFVYFINDLKELAVEISDEAVTRIFVILPLNS